MQLNLANILLFAGIGDGPSRRRLGRGPVGKLADSAAKPIPKPADTKRFLDPHPENGLGCLTWINRPSAPDNKLQTGAEWDEACVVDGGIRWLCVKINYRLLTPLFMRVYRDHIQWVVVRADRLATARWRQPCLWG